MDEVRLPFPLIARNVGFTKLLHLHQELVTFTCSADAPLPWWLELREKATGTHRAIDMQLMLATGDDIETHKEMKRSCPPTQR